MLVVTFVTAPCVRHDEIDSSGLRPHSLEEGLHLRVVGLVGARGDATSSARRHRGCGLVDRRPAGHVDGCPGIAERAA